MTCWGKNFFPSKRHYLLANKNFMRQFNHRYSYHVIYIERWERGTKFFSTVVHTVVCIAFTNRAQHTFHSH